VAEWSKARAWRGANVTSNDDILSLKPHEMYEFPHNVFFAAVVEGAF
jgi:hypothetical protein